MDSGESTELKPETDDASFKLLETEENLLNSKTNNTSLELEIDDASFKAETNDTSFELLETEDTLLTSETNNTSLELEMDDGSVKPETENTSKTKRKRDSRIFPNYSRVAFFFSAVFFA